MTLRLLKTAALFAQILFVVGLMSCGRDSGVTPDEGVPPEADFTFTVEGKDASFKFTGTGQVDSYAWEFGDGETSAERDPDHTYAAAGSFDVTLNVTNDDGTDETVQTVIIENDNLDLPDMPELTLSDADGVVYAVNTYHQVNGEEDKIGSGYAWFVNGTSLADVGTVSWKQGSNTAELEQQDDDTYTYTETESPTDGFKTSSGVAWSIQGGDGHGSINGLSNGWPFPPLRRSDETNVEISGSNPYTVAHTASAINTDSTFFAIHGPDGVVMKRFDGTINNATFTSAEMTSLGKGQAIIEITSFGMYSTTLGGKKYYAINTSRAAREVTIK